MGEIKFSLGLNFGGLVLYKIKGALTGFWYLGDLFLALTVHSLGAVS